MKDEGLNVSPTNRVARLARVDDGGNAELGCSVLSVCVCVCVCVRAYVCVCVLSGNS